MLRRRANSRGLAEIVGTLMLVLIVVSAAVAFSFFVASYEAQVQAEETLNHEQALENIHILSVAPNLIPTGPGWYPSMNFTIASEYIYNSSITYITINNQPVKTYNVTAFDTSNGTFVTTVVPAGASLNLGPREQATIWITFNGGTKPATNPSFYSSFDLASSDYIEIALYTAYNNEFSRVFIPPTAIAVVTTTDTSGTLTTLLDGSQSFQPESNATIVSWDWTVYNKNTSSYVLPDLSGEEAETVSPLDLADQYLVNLTVTNSDGLESIATVLYPSS
jgi:flagellin-like protein